MGLCHSNYDRLDSISHGRPQMSDCQPQLAKEGDLTAKSRHSLFLTPCALNYEDAEYGDRSPILDPTFHMTWLPGSEPADYRSQREVMLYAKRCCLMINKSIKEGWNDESQQGCERNGATAKLCKSRGRYNWTIKFPDRSERFQTIEFDPFNDARVDEREGAAQKRQRGRA